MAGLSVRAEDTTAARTGGTGLGLRGARWAMFGVWALNVCRGVLDGSLGTSTPWLVWLGFAAGLPGALLLTRPGGDRLRTGDAVGVVACALLVALSVTARAELPDPPEQVWILNYASYLMALLVARGNPVWGGVGGALVLLIGAGWVSYLDAGPAGYGDVLGIPVTALAVGCTWRVALRRMSAREEAYELAEARATSERLEVEATDAATRRELAAVATQVSPLLAQIVEGRRIDEGFALRLSVAEAGIRDRLRSPRLQHPLLTAAIARTRRQAVEVVVFGEDPAGQPALETPGGGRVAIGDALARAVVDLIAPVPEGARVMIRLAPTPGPTALTVTVSAGGTTRRTDLSADGEVVAAH